MSQQFAAHSALAAKSPIYSDSLPRVIAFVYTVRFGSFSAAARRLGLSPSAVGKSVSRLEATLGVRLLQRTTRKLTLSDIGEGVFERYTQALQLLNEVDVLASQQANSLTGMLRLNVPKVYGARVIGPLLANFADMHPLVTLDVRFEDELCNLAEAGVDLAVRIGEVAESRLIARHFDWQHWAVVASPAYLERYGVPEHPQLLAGHRCLGFRHASQGRVRPWRFQLGDQVHHLTLEHRYLFDEGIALKRAAEAGFGITQIPRIMMEHGVARGSLVCLLEAFQPEPDPISLVYMSQNRYAPKLKSLVDFILQEAQHRVKTVPH